LSGEFFAKILHMFRSLLTWHESARLPREEGHDAVVDDVQRRHVVELLARQEEEGVEELGELAEEVPPRRSGHAIAWGKCSWLLSGRAISATFRRKRIEKYKYLVAYALK
jgi:hypothetical protein